MDKKALNKLSEQYNITRQKFYSVLKQEMPSIEKNVPPLEKVDFEKELSKLKIPEYRETSIKSLDSIKDKKLFEDSGFPLVVYKKVQLDLDERIKKGKPYVYHLCYCDALKRSTEDELLKDWVKVRPKDNCFEIIPMRNKKLCPKEMTDKMKVCKKCFDTLKLERLKYRADKFDIKRYIREYPPVSTEKLKMPKVYSFDMNMSDEYTLSAERKEVLKRVRGYRCERCGLNCEHDHSRLEIHHKDRHRSNNSVKNLEVICSCCHDKEHPDRPKRC